MDDPQPPPQNTFPPHWLVCGCVVRIDAPPDSPQERGMTRPLIAAAFLLALGVRLAADDSSSPQSPVPSPSLHEQIDALVEAAAIGPLAPVCSDADFVRRVYLDLTGVIPTADQARSSVADTAADKRERLIDELLASPAFDWHMTITLDVMLMERKPEKAVKQVEWEAFLYRSLADDKPLDELFRELVAADGADEKLRPAARFVLDRDAEPNLVTRDIGRLVFGMDLQCCQCHDHPLIDDYYQDDYYGLFAFVHRTSLFTDAKSKQIALTEKADGEASFKSVFTGASSDKALTRLPKGAVLFVEPAYAKGDEYTIKPDKTVRGVPKFSRRAALADMIPASREFSHNLANRLWAHLLGRGIVHPFDFHYAANPPTHPRLLSLLADELATGGFKLRPLLRQIAMTRVYQRSCDAPRPEIVNFADIAARLDRLSAEKSTAQQSVQPVKDALAQAKAAIKLARDDDAKIAAALPKLQAAVAEAKQSVEKAKAEQQAAKQRSAKLADQAQAVAAAAAKLSDAATKLPDDKLLSDAAAKIGALSGQLSSARDAAVKTLNEQAGANDAAATRLAEAEATLATTTVSRPSIDRLRDLEQVQLTAEHQLADANYAIAAIDTQASMAKAILDYDALSKTDPEKAAAAWPRLVERWTIAGQIAPLKPLTPEQLAASAMQASGAFAPQLTAATAKVAKSKLDTSLSVPFFHVRIGNGDNGAKDRLYAGKVELELLNQLRGPFAEFVRQYGGLPGQEFQATVNQALFFGNGGVIDGWLSPKGDNLAARLAKI